MPAHDPGGRRQVALLAHGTGSTPEFVQRTFGTALGELGYHVRSWRWPSAGGSEPGHGAELDLVAELAEHVRNHRPALVGGVSLGAHAAAAWAAETGWRGPLLLVMPAWTGAPGPAAQLAAATADAIAASGVDTVLATADPRAHPWVAAELATAWRTYSPELLVAALRAAAATPSPREDDLRRVEATCAVVGLDGDPAHPLDVAERWAALVPGAGFESVALPADGSAPHLGAAAARALAAVSGSRRSPGRARAG